MKNVFRVIIILVIGFFSIAYSQQDSYVIVREYPMPDSTKHLFDSLTVKKIDTNKVNRGWLKLKKGLTQSNVVKLIGKPSKFEFSSFDASETWYYEKRTVVFDNIKQTLRYWEK